MKKGSLRKPTHKNFTQLTKNSCLVASEWCWKTQAIADCTTFQHSPNDYPNCSHYWKTCNASWVYLRGVGGGSLLPFRESAITSKIAHKQAVEVKNIMHTHTHFSLSIGCTVIKVKLTTHRWARLYCSIFDY